MDEKKRNWTRSRDLRQLVTVPFFCASFRVYNITVYVRMEMRMPVRAPKNTSFGLWPSRVLSSWILASLSFLGQCFRSSTNIWKSERIWLMITACCPAW